MAEEHSTRREALRKVLIAGPLAALGLLAGANIRKAQAADGTFDNLTVNNRAGIGTTPSTTKLEVSGPRGTSYTGQLLVTGASDHGYMQVRTTSAATKETGVQIIGQGAVDAPDWTIYTAANSRDLRFHNGASAVATLKNNGNVGIGTTDPAYPLDVAGTARANEVLAADHIAVTGGLYPRIQSDVADTPLFVGAGNSSSGKILVVAKNDFGNTANHIATFTNGGDVGIGTTSPQAKLDVAGSIKVSGVLEGVSRKAYYDQ